MTARLCKNCAYVGLRMQTGAEMQLCRIMSRHRPLTVDARASGQPCGPDGDQFSPKKDKA